MKFFISNMDRLTAKEISRWAYIEPYSMYSMDGSEDTIIELMNGSYHSVCQNNMLFGYFCFGESAQVPIGNNIGAYNDKKCVDIGLGLKPELCGKGYGYSFISAGLNYARNTFSKKHFRLTVALFNDRAIKVYKKLGFNETNISFNKIDEKGNTEFIVMTLENQNDIRIL